MFNIKNLNFAGAAIIAVMAVAIFSTPAMADETRLQKAIDALALATLYSNPDTTAAEKEEAKKMARAEFLQAFNQEIQTSGAPSTTIKFEDFEYSIYQYNQLDYARERAAKDLEEKQKRLEGDESNKLWAENPEHNWSQHDIENAGKQVSRSETQVQEAEDKLAALNDVYIPPVIFEKHGEEISLANLTYEAQKVRYYRNDRDTASVRLFINPVSSGIKKVADVIQKIAVPKYYIGETASFNFEKQKTTRFKIYKFPLKTGFLVLEVGNDGTIRFKQDEKNSELLTMQEFREIMVELNGLLYNEDVRLSASASSMPRSSCPPTVQTTLPTELASIGEILDSPTMMSSSDIPRERQLYFDDGTASTGNGSYDGGYYSGGSSVGSYTLDGGIGTGGLLHVLGGAFSGW